MKTSLVAGLVLAATFAYAADTPRKKQSGMSEDMRQAIAFERYKDLAAARQARKEERHPSVTYNNSTANRTAEETTEGNKVKDAGPPPKKDK